MYILFANPSYSYITSSPNFTRCLSLLEGFGEEQKDLAVDVGKISFCALKGLYSLGSITRNIDDESVFNLLFCVEKEVDGKCTISYKALKECISLLHPFVDQMDDDEHFIFLLPVMESEEYEQQFLEKLNELYLNEGVKKNVTVIRIDASKRMLSLVD